MTPNGAVLNGKFQLGSSLFNAVAEDIGSGGGEGPEKNDQEEKEKEREREKQRR